MKVLLTGSSGRIGRVVKPAIEEAGHVVVPFDLVNGQDILKPEQLRSAMSGCNMVVHLAGIPGPVRGTSFAGFFSPNCQGTFAVMEAAVDCGIGRVIYSGSTAFYGVEPGIPYRSPVEEGQAPFTCYVRAGELKCKNEHIGYDVSKVIAEQILAYYGLNRIVETVSLRFGPINRDTDVNLAAQAIVKALSYPGAFYYEVINVLDADCDWGRTEKMTQVLGVIA